MVKFTHNGTSCKDFENSVNRGDYSEPDPAIVARLEFIRQAYVKSMSLDNFDRSLVSAVRVLSGTCSASGTSGTSNYSTTVPREYSNDFNKKGSVHGGAIAALLDNIGNCGIAVVSRRGFWDQGGVTKSLQISYLRLAKAGEEVLVNCEVVHAGSRTATMRLTLTRESDGEALAVCTMEKGDAQGRAKL